MLPLQSWAATKLLEKSWGQRMLKQVSQLYYYVSVIVSSILKWFALSYCFTVACFSVYLQPLIFLWVNNVDEIKQWKKYLFALISDCVNQDEWDEWEGCTSFWYHSAVWFWTSWNQHFLTPTKTFQVTPTLQNVLFTSHLWVLLQILYRWNIHSIVAESKQA